MATAAEIGVILDGDDSGLTQAAKRGQATLNKFSKDAGDSAEKLHKRVSDAFDKLGERTVKAGAALSASLTLPIVAAGKKMVEESGKLEQAVANISTIKPEINFQQVYKGLNEMQRRVPEAAADLGDALYDIFSSIEVSQSDAMRLVEQFSKSAVGAQTSTKTFGTAAIGILNAYKLSVKDAAHVSDLFFNTVNKGVITGEQLASSLGPVTASAKAAGVSLNEMFAVIAAGTKEGGDAAQNVNNINNLFQKITTAPAQKEIKALGVATTTAAGKFRPILDVATDLKKKLDSMTQSARATEIGKIFPDAQARQGLQTLLSQLDFAKEVLKENANSSGAAEAAYKKMSVTWQNQSKLFQNTVNSVLIQIGTVVLPIVTKAVQALTPVVIKVADAFSKMPETGQLFTLALLAIAAAAGPLLLAIGGIITAVGAIGLPLLAAVAAVAALGAAFATNFGGIRDLVMGVVADFQPEIEAMMAGFDVVKAWFMDSLPGMASEAKTNFTAIMQVVKSASAYVFAAIGQYWEPVKAWFLENWPLMQRTVQTVLEAIQVFWKDHGEQIIAILKGVWAIIAATVATAVKLVGDIIRFAMQVINGDWAGAWQTFLTFLGHIWDGVRSIVSAGWDTVKALLGGIVSFLGDLGSRVGSAALGIGKAIMDGIVNGVKAGANLLKDVVVDSVMTPVNAVKELLGIHSPSTVFEEIGANMNRGTIKGLGKTKAAVILAALGVMTAVIDQVNAVANDPAVIRYRTRTEGAREALARAREEYAVEQQKTELGKELVRIAFENAGAEERVIDALKKQVTETMKLRAMKDELRAINDRINEKTEKADKEAADRIEKINEAGKKWDEQQAADAEELWKINKRIDDKLQKQDEDQAKRNAKATEAASKAVEEAADRQQKALNQVANNLAERFTGIFDTIIKGSVDNMFTNLFTGFRKMLQDMAAEYLRSQMYRFLYGALGGKSTTGNSANGIVAGDQANLPGAGGGQGLGNLIGKIGGFLGGLFGHRDVGGLIHAGRDVMVGGNGPEIVRVGSTSRVFSNRDSQRVGGGGGDTHIWNIQTQDAASFIKSKDQILGKFGGGIDRVKRRNNGR